MEREILALRKALVHYEECVDVCAAEHIMGDALTNLNKCLRKLQEEVNEQMLEMLSDM